MIDVEGEALEPIAEEVADGNQITIDDMVSNEQTDASDTAENEETEAYAEPAADNGEDTTFTSEN